MGEPGADLFAQTAGYDDRFHAVSGGQIQPIGEQFYG
jgi:hypothetical protein